jgi:hypothetical protein
MRPSNKRMYIFAFIITAAIFFLGFFFGFLMDLKRTDYFEQSNEINKLNIRSLQLQEDLMTDENFSNQCGAFRFMFDKTIVELENNRERLESYGRQAKVNTDKFDLLKREYVISQINFWRIAKKIKEVCPNSSDFVTLLYFFSDSSSCPVCDNQAAILTYYKNQLQQNILIFSINEKLADQEPIIQLMQQAYQVKVYPTLIILNDMYPKYVDKEELRTILCRYYTTNETRDKICNGQ